MSSPLDSSRRARFVRWGGRVAFLASLLALLGTSKPKGWSVSATPVGPKTAVGPKALEVTINASKPVDLETSGAKKKPGFGRGAPCNAAWVAGKPLVCLVAAGESLDSVEIRGSCGGCSDGCPPPPGSFVNATTREVDTWTDAARASITVNAPKHPPKFIATRFMVLASGASIITAKLKVTPKGGGPKILEEEQSCGLDESGHVACLFLLMDDLLASPRDVDVEIEATGIGSCASAACAPPKTLKVDSLAVLE